MERYAEAKKLNTELGLIELRAQATAVGLVQLCSELLSAGVLTDDAIDRIKSAISDQIMVSYRQKRSRDEFEVLLRRRLDKIFPVSGPAGHPATGVGTADEIRSDLGL